MRLRAGDKTILCPFDRQPTIIGDSSVWGLKKKFALLELLERLQSSPSSHFLHINKAKNANDDNREVNILYMQFYFYVLMNILKFFRYIATVNDAILLSVNIIKVKNVIPSSKQYNNLFQPTKCGIILVL